MKIAIDCRMLSKGGIGTYLSGILDSLIDLRHFYLLIGDKKMLNKYEAENVKIISCNIPIFTISETLRYPYRQLKDCDVFFSPNYNIPMFINIPLVTTIHDVIYLDLMFESNGFFGYWLRRFFLSLAIKKSKHIFTVSKFSESRIRYHFNKVKEISVTGVGINSNLVEAKSRCNYNFDYCLYIGNIKTHKGIDTLLESYKLFKVKYKLIIVGEKNNFLNKNADITNIILNNPEIIFTGRISDDELQGILCNAKILIQPSRYEGFGIPPLEALSVGVPVIVSNISVFKEVYSGLPVTFFEVDNPLDLADKVLGQNTKRIAEYVKEYISKKYSYDCISNTIARKLEQIGTKY
ncbi:glycosyltransferase family 4 protein [Spirochaeta cellobiosiphila]|uniref:glycosyltransferase family 4 protein n=1 Tax=Spirochaeta cellobiosiphila TaxID=504483 RepID=UPI0004052F51|nr:glycosyltransferase family 1 protein [Spirochaeta cellobiosiphila]